MSDDIAGPPSKRTKVERAPQRARYDAETIEAIIDEALVCHLGYAVDGEPFVLPTMHARSGDRLFVHGSAANHALKVLGGDIEACIAITLVDGVVLARSGFHHSLNYRSVIIFGSGRLLTDEVDKADALRSIVEHAVPGSSDDCRGPSKSELAWVSVLEFRLDECSAKVRTGPPADVDGDLGLPYWAGEIPLETSLGAPIPSPDLADDIELPEFVLPGLSNRRI